MIVEAPNSDLSEDIKKDYFEAANIFTDSPSRFCGFIKVGASKTLYSSWRKRSKY